MSYITENGLVSGQALNGSIDPLTGYPAENAVLWKDGRIINLGTLGGYESGGGRVNSRGQIAGYSDNMTPDQYSLLGFPTETRAFLWDGQNGMQDIGTLGGPDAFAFAVNERGQVVGFSYPGFTPTSNCFPLVTDGFVWEKNTGMTDLGTLGGTCTLPGDINNAGEVVGSSNLAGDLISHIFVWIAPGPMRDLGSALGGSCSFASQMNEAGEFVGQACTARDQGLHAYIRKNGLFADLGTLPGLDDTCIGAFGINARGQATGQAVENFCSGPRAHAFLWENGDMIDLNAFVPQGVGITLTEVEQINDRGEMFGGGTLTNGESRAFLLIPCDDDAAAVDSCMACHSSTCCFKGAKFRCIRSTPMARLSSSEKCLECFAKTGVYSP